MKKKSISELKKLCKEQGLKKYSSLKKKQLIELLQQNIKGEEEPLENVLENVIDNELEDINDINEKMKKLDFNEEEIVEEY